MSNGYLEILSTEHDLPALPDGPGIEAQDPMSEAGRKVFRFHFQRMLHNEPGTRCGEDIDALHDMRVATRRMRAAVRVFGAYYDQAAFRPHLKGLRRTGRALGAVRDLDVFREKVLAYLTSLSDSEPADMKDLLSTLETRREAARERMVRYLDSGKYRKFVAQFAEFVETEGQGSLPMVPNGGEPEPYRVCHVAPVAVYERLAAVRAYDEWVSIPEPPLTRLHSLRITCKRLRYTLEFFGEVLGGETNTLIRKVVGIQDHLGDLQDAVVASEILRSFLVWGTWGDETTGAQSAGSREPEASPGVTAYLAATHLSLQELLDSFPRAWQGIVGEEFSQMVANAVAVL